MDMLTENLNRLVPTIPPYNQNTQASDVKHDRDQFVLSFFKWKSWFIKTGVLPNLQISIWNSASWNALWMILDVDYRLSRDFYLPKFTIFGKYVRLSVCYLPKFSIFASMFVCRFVCLSVRFVKHNSWTLWHIITKLGPHMEWVSSSSMWHWQISRSWN